MQKGGGGGGGRGGLVSLMWTSAWKKNYSYHICEIYSENLAVCLYIKFSFCFYSTENKKLYGPFFWMGFNCFKAKATPRRQFTFYH